MKKIIDKYKFALLYIAIVVGLVMTASRPRIELSAYHEECFEYEQLPVLKNITYKQYNPYCTCMRPFSDPFETCDRCYENITIYYNSTKAGKCIKYHLIRDAEEGI